VRRRATVAAIEPVEMPPAAPRAARDDAAALAAAARPAFQPSLFAGKEAPKVVSIRPGGEVRPQSVKGSSHRASVGGTRRFEQQKLGLVESADETRKRQREGAVSCNAPVAGIAHRLLAFVIDTALVAGVSGAAIAGSVFLGGVELAGKPAAIFCGAGVLLVWLLYQLLWCAANLDTAGMCWVRLRCLDFNGYRPRARQRLIRFGMLCLGALAAGLGLAWALVDEEGLAWQDHVSETFPTTY
jgi:uncharacterized RDD family membrane protein YckC